MEDQLIWFLTSRNISDSTIQKLKAENITAAVITVMDEVDLKQFFPCFGDRVMIRNFCVDFLKNKKDSRENNTIKGTKRKDDLIQQLKKKLKSCRNSGVTDDEREVDEGQLDRWNHLKGNSFATKEDRSIDLGWIISIKDGPTYQVRSKTGGGTRRVKVSKNAKKKDLLNLSKSLFFPNGESMRGSLSDFEECDILDFKQKSFPQDKTVEEMYQQTKMTRLRFYLSTTTKMNIDCELDVNKSMDEKYDSDHLPDLSFHFKHERSPVTASAVTLSSPPTTATPQERRSCTTTATVTLSSQTENGDVAFSMLETLQDGEKRSIASSTHTRTFPSFMENATLSSKMETLEPLSMSTSVPSQMQTPSDSEQVPSMSQLTYPTQKHICSQLHHLHDNVYRCEICMTVFMEDSGIDFESSKPIDYNTYSEYMEIMDNKEDLDLQTAIANSIDDVSIPHPSKEFQEKSVAELLSTLQQKVEGQEMELIINRRRIIKSLQMQTASKGTDFSYTRPVRIKFSGEEATDEGGPRREFFWLLMKEIVENMGIFEGQPGHLLFNYNLENLKSQKYFTAGVYVAWSLMQGGPSLSIMDKTMVKCMANENAVVDVCAALPWLPDSTARQNIEKLTECDNELSFCAMKLDMSDWLIDTGTTNLNKVTFNNRMLFAAGIVKHYFYYRIHPAIEQFKQGLRTVWGALQQNENFVQILCASDIVLTSDAIRDRYEIEWSEEQSNRRIAEADTIFSWEVFLKECEAGTSGFTLADILQFWTGSGSFPPDGFHQKMTISFYSQKEKEPGKKKETRLPSAHTCACVLMLPRGVDDPEELKELMKTALIGCKGFGLI